MDDLAAMAGVSKVTVSRALSGSPLVASDTRTKIRELATQHGYHVNPHARSLRMRKNYTVAVVVEMDPTPERPMSDPYPLEILGGVSQRLTTAGYNLLLTTTQSLGDDQVRSVDGAILLGQGAWDAAARRLEALGLPLVVWGAGRGDQGYVVVGTDNRQGGALAAERLLTLGRKRMAFLGDTDHAEAAARLSGFSQVIAAAGGELVACVSCPFTFAGGFNAAEAALASSAEPFDGLFCASDLIAMGAIRSLNDHRLLVPGDVSVIGYDDTPVAASFVPAITSIHQSWREGGVLMAEKILALIDGKTACSETLPARISIRTS
jgi:DNA-binding LacI/PurR family transcriptional regulator